MVLLQVYSYSSSSHDFRYGLAGGQIKFLVDVQSSFRPVKDHEDWQKKTSSTFLKSWKTWLIETWKIWKKNYKRIMIGQRPPTVLQAVLWSLWLPYKFIVCYIMMYYVKIIETANNNIYFDIRVHIICRCVWLFNSFFSFFFPFFWGGGVKP